MFWSGPLHLSEILLGPSLLASDCSRLLFVSRPWAVTIANSRKSFFCPYLTIHNPNMTHKHKPTSYLGNFLEEPYKANWATHRCSCFWTGWHRSTTKSCKRGKPLVLPCTRVLRWGNNWSICCANWRSSKRSMELSHRCRLCRLWDDISDGNVCMLTKMGSSRSIRSRQEIARQHRDFNIGLMVSRDHLSGIGQKLSTFSDRHETAMSDTSSLDK